MTDDCKTCEKRQQSEAELKASTKVKTIENVLCPECYDLVDIQVEKDDDDDADTN